jgi:hypothetical protein
MANNHEPEGREELPMFQSGGVVKETGLAVVHEGEYSCRLLAQRPQSSRHR